MSGMPASIVPDSIAIAILTIDREPQYVHATIESLQKACRGLSRMPIVHVVVGCADSTYLDRYKSDASISIRELPPDLAALNGKFSIYRRFCLNYWRCLGISLDGKSGICICEDDVVFRDGFLPKLCDTIRQMIEEAALSNHVLAAYAAYDFETNPSLYRRTLYCSYYAPSFYGTQCMYYSKGVVPALRQYLYDRGIRTEGPPGDMIIKEFCIEHNNLYACTRSLVQHVGARSTGLGHHHQSPTFQRQFQHLPRW